MRLLADPGTNRHGRLLYLYGPASAAKRGTARAACAQAGRPLLLVDVQAVLAAYAERAGSLLVASVREALLQGAVLAFDGFDALLAEEPLANLALGILRRSFADSVGAVLLLGELRWEPSAWLPVRAGLRLDLSPLAAGDRVRLWRSQVDGQLPADAVTELAVTLPTGRRRRHPRRRCRGAQPRRAARRRPRSSLPTCTPRRAPSPRHLSKDWRATSSRAMAGTTSCCPPTAWPSCARCALALATR